jgi:3-oxoacyl-[acyl-carrier protein] reductase
MNKHILITGGSSDIALTLIGYILEKTPYHMVITRHNQPLPIQHERITELYAELSTEEGIQQFLDNLNAYPIDFYIQLQGDAVPSDVLEDQTLSSLQASLNINTLSTILVISKIIEHMKRNLFGRITLMSTASASFGGGKESFAYGLSKYSVNYIVKHLAKYFSKYNIITNSVAPGFIQTSFHEIRLHRDQKFLEERAKSVRLQRAGTAEDIAKTIYHLTFENNFICGETIKIDGADFI